MFLKFNSIGTILKIKDLSVVFIVFNVITILLYFLIFIASYKSEYKQFQILQKMIVKTIIKTLNCEIFTIFISAVHLKKNFS